MSKELAKKERGGTVSAYILTQDGELVDEAVLNGFTVKRDLEGSRKLKPEARGGQTSISGLVPFPFESIENLARLPELNTSLWRSIKALVNDSVGMGWSLEAREGIENPSEEQRDRVLEFLEDCHPEKEFTELLKIMCQDYCSTGNACLELLKHDPLHEPQGLENILITTMKKHRDGKRALHERGNKKVWYRLAGIEEAWLNYETGVFAQEVPEDKRANELIWIKNHVSTNDYYGVPDFMPAVGAVLGDRMRQEYNIDFFKHFAMPAYAVTVSGTTLDEPTRQQIREYFQKDLKKHRHATLVITAKKDSNSLNPEPIEIKFHPLSVEQKEASFRMYREDNVDEIFTSEGVPPYRAGLVRQGSLGGNVEQGTTEIYKNSVIYPIQWVFINKINTHILWNGFQAFDWTLAFEEIDTKDERHEAEQAALMQVNGWMTPNQAREYLGLPRVEGVPEMDMYYMNGLPLGRAEDVITKRIEHQKAMEELRLFGRDLRNMAWSRGEGLPEEE